MAHRTFVAFASADPFVSAVIVDACKAVTSDDHDFIPWNQNDVSGQPIDRSVYGWVDAADALVADISEPNHNVTYEVGLALGSQKPLRLIRAANKDRKVLEEIGLLHNIGHADFRDRAHLTALLRRPYTTSAWPLKTRNKDQPIYVIQSVPIDDLLRRAISGVKKFFACGFAILTLRKLIVSLPLKHLNRWHSLSE
jgi:hypothetical protein